MKNILAIPLLVLFLAAQSIQAATLPDTQKSPGMSGFPGITGFIDEMVEKHKFKRAELDRVFAHTQHVTSVIEAISRPATAKPWLEYRAAFVNPQRVRLGLDFWRRYQKTLRRAELKYGVPQDIIVALIGVETIYGQDQGTFRTIDALTTLAFDYPPRSSFFRRELENYLLLAREQQFDLLAIRSSYAGALGIPQFMPSSYRTYAVDFNGNHKIDLLHEANDAIGSVANYLKGYGWVSDASGVLQPTGKLLPHKGQIKLTPPIAVRAQVSEEICAGDITTPRTLAAWSAIGIVPIVNLAQNQSARLIDFTVGESDEKHLMQPLPIRLSEQTTLTQSQVMSGPKKEFWLVFNNFDVITRYNNSDFYAMSVFQLAEALKQARKTNRAK